MDLKEFLEQNPIIEKDKLIIKGSINKDICSFIFLDKIGNKLFEYSGNDLKYNEVFQTISNDYIQIYIGE